MEFTAMFKKSRAGFTLVELLVVITIIGMLVALLFPAISSALRAARRAQCVNNLRNVAQGTQTFHTQRTKFPGSLNEFDNTATAGNPPDYWVSWHVQLLPHIEQQPLYDLIKNNNAPNQASVIPVFKCPEHDIDSSVVAPNSYVANCGRMDVLTDLADLTNPIKQIDHKVNGLFFRHYRKGGNTFPAGNNYSKKTIDISLDDIYDGSSNTLMYSENIQCGPWTSADQSYEQFVGAIWYPYADDSQGLLPATQSHHINRLRDDVPANAAAMYNYARPSSDHGTGVNAAMADGSVRWLSEDISYSVYCLIMSSNGQKIWEPGFATADTNGSTLNSAGKATPNSLWLQTVLSEKDLQP